MKPRLTLYLRDMRREHPKDSVTPSYRPRTRGDCENRLRPCPFISCRHHLFIDVTPAGSIKMAFGESEDALWEMKETCSLDVAERGDHDMNVLGKYLGVTAARIQQEVVQATAKLKEQADAQGLRFEDLFHEAPSTTGDESFNRLASQCQREIEADGETEKPDD